MMRISRWSSNQHLANPAQSKGDLLKLLLDSNICARAWATWLAIKEDTEVVLLLQKKLHVPFHNISSLTAYSDEAELTSLRSLVNSDSH